MRRIALAAASVLALSATLVARAPAMDLGQLPADTQWFVHVDGTTAFAGEFGRLVRDVLASPDVSAKMAALTAITGFDPLKDLVSAAVAGSGPGEQQAVLFLQGRFDQNRLVTLVRAVDGYALSDHGGVGVHRWRDQDKPGKPFVFAAFLGSDLLAFTSGEPALKQAIDAIGNRAPRFSPPTIAGPGVIAWAQAEDLAALTAGKNDAAAFKNVQAGWATLAEKDGALVAEVALTATDAASAEQLTKLANGLLALAQLSSDPKADPVGAALVASLRVAAADRTVRLSASCPVGTLRQHPDLQGKVTPTAPAAVPER
ncbi:MAG TPA: hypothetical protein VEL07_16700 [Planctomycetota bacterium]|nr:hypothetical protein [Planctomycetota bacterium]